MTTETPGLVLSIFYWLHMLATVVWIGGLASFSILVMPLARKIIEPTAYSQLLEKSFKRLQQIGWLCLAVLTVTGLFQMSANPNYMGLLAIDNTWSAAILIKHLFVGVMVLAGLYGSFVVIPELEKMTLIRLKNPELGDEQRKRLDRREALLLYSNLVLAIIILFLTALARVS
jgi:uncharacterized membrane protein